MLAKRNAAYAPLLAKITELSTVSREDMRQWQTRTGASWWKDHLNALGGQLDDLMKAEVIDVTLAYFAYLQKEWQDVRDKHGR
jgi:nucleoside-specific outer membrane channel protein Tsx